MIKKIIRFFTDKYYRNAPMVSYWKTKEAVNARLIVHKDGHYMMDMEGEKYPFPGYPRGFFLFGSLAKLKHEIKNQTFNTIWYKLEEKISNEDIMSTFRKETIPNLQKLVDDIRLDMAPYEKMVPPVKEIYRVFTKIEEETGNRNIKLFKDILTCIMQEDDAYRWRLQDLAQYMNEGFQWKRDYLKELAYGFDMLELAEAVGDMKERERLWKRGFLFLLSDREIYKTFQMFCKEVNWNKLYLTKEDKYFFRAKYYKVDRRYYDY